MNMNERNHLTYNITLLAMSYCETCVPGNARRRLNYMLRTDPELWEELKKAHYRSRQRYFTPRQYELIVKYLGKPE